MRILVFGGRRYPYESFVHDEIIQLTDGVPLREVTVIHGDANREEKTGADYWAHTFCEQWRSWGLIEHRFPAAWDDTTAPGALIRTRQGKPYNVRAGFSRNQLQLDWGAPTHALGFPGGTGTADMLSRIKLAIERGAKIDLHVFE